MLKAPAIVFVAVVFLFYFLQLSFVIGIVILLISIIGNYVLGEFSKRYFSNTMEKKDLRKNKLAEALSNIKFLKLYSLTDNYFDQIDHLRN